jgi:hypothetical protein
MALDRLLVIDQGSKFEYTAAVTIHGQVVPLTGWTARLQVRGDWRLNQDLLAELTEADALTVVDDPPQVLIDIPGATSLLWDWERGQYDLYVFEPTPGAMPHRIMQGEMRVNKTVLSQP